MSRCLAGGWLTAVLAWLLPACSSTAPPAAAPEPALRAQAQELEADGVRRLARGDYTAALGRLSEAARLQQSLDDVAALARVQLGQARAQLALGQAKEALAHAQAAAENAPGMEPLMLQAQAHLALGQASQARGILDRLALQCAASCDELGSLRILQARAALAGGQAQESMAHAKAALAILRDKKDETQAGNAWRIMGVSHLMLGDLPAALAAAQTSLEIDRRLGLPEKIARDWLLVGDVQRKSGAPEATQAYRRALSVAQAAGLKEVVKLASEALKDSP